MCDLHFKFEVDRTKMRSLSWTIGISDRRTRLHTMKWLISAVHCIGQTISGV